MALKNYNPTSPSRRALVLVDKSDIYKGKPVKKLTRGLSKTGGRNNRGRTTVWWKGGGHKRSYRIIDFKRQKDNINAEVIRIEYDPNRSCHIALLKYEDGSFSYILAPQKIKIQSSIASGENVDIKIGNCLPLKNIPTGTLVHNVEMKPLKYEDLGLILTRLLIVYIIIEPSLYFCVNNCKNLGEASAIINMNVLFAFFISCYLYKTPIDMTKLLGIFLVVGGSYFIVK